MKIFLKKISEAIDVKKIKVFVREKVDAEIERVVRRYNEKQQAQQPQETADAAQGTCNDLPQFKAIAMAEADTPTSFDTKLVTSTGDLQQVLASDTVVLTTISQLPQETETETADVPANDIESALVTIPAALAATDFDDSSNSNAEPVLTVGTPQVEHG